MAYDPVSYFIGPEPHQGKPDFEYQWGGVPWYFESAANRDVFMRAPEIYAPQYGGHCLTSLSRGYLSDGKPQLYVVEALKLYFFYSTANRDAFELSKTEALTSAAAHWPELSQQLVGVTAAVPAGEAPAADAPADHAADAGATADGGGEHGSVAPSGADANVH